jgi:hypothetical protein
MGCCVVKEPRTYSFLRRLKPHLDSLFLRTSQTFLLVALRFTSELGSQARLVSRFQTSHSDNHTGLAAERVLKETKRDR